MIDKNGKGLVFLLSLPRSGSTLLSAILSRHHSIHTPNEPWILLSLASIYNLDPPPSSVARMRYDEAWALRAIRDFLSQEQFTNASRAFAISAYQSSLDAVGKSIFVDKTPRYFHILPWMDELFPQSRKIWLLRNPLDVAASYLTTWGDTLGELTGDPIMPRSYDLVIGLKQLADFSDSNRFILKVRYEDIVASPEPVLQRICEHLNVPYQLGMIEYNKGTGFKERYRHALGDKNLFEHAAPHVASIGRWEKVLDPAGLQRLIDFLGAEIFERMGYQDTIHKLKAMGIRFPSDADVADRQSVVLSKTLDSPLSSLEGVINIARDYYREARKRNFPPWFLTISGLRARSVKKKLVSARDELLLIQKQRGQE